MIEKPEEEKNSSLRESTHHFEANNNKSHIILYDERMNSVDKEDLELKIRIEIYKNLPAWRKGFIGYILGDFDTVLYKNSNDEEKLIRVATTKEADQVIRLIEVYSNLQNKNTEKNNNASLLQSAIEIILSDIPSSEKIKQISQSAINIEIPQSSKEIIVNNSPDVPNHLNTRSIKRKRSIFLPEPMNEEMLSNKTSSQRSAL